MRVGGSSSLSSLRYQHEFVGNQGFLFALYLSRDNVTGTVYAEPPRRVLSLCATDRAPFQCITTGPLITRGQPQEVFVENHWKQL